MTNIDPLLQAMFYRSRLGQVVTDPDGIILEANPAMEGLLDCPRGYLTGKPITNFLLPEDADYLSRPGHQTEIQLMSGAMTEPIWGLANITPVQDQDGNVWAHLTQIQDLTAKKALENELRRNAKDLEQFAYIASHDLREPLITMAGYAALLKRRCASNLSEDGRHFIEEILGSTVRMERKIDDLLAFSRAGRTEPRGEFLLSEALLDAQQHLKRSIERSQATITLEANPIPLRGEQGLIAQVLQNLIGNAIKYRGKESPVIQITQVITGNCVTVRVQDNGLGFGMEHRDRIFGVFTRLYTNEEYPGTGIGLAIAKKIVERHGGTIWADSVLGRGSTFSFTLQCHRD